MATIAMLFGATVGCGLITALAFALTKAWPMSAQKIVVVCGVLFLILSLGDNALRDEPMAETFARIGIAEAIVMIFFLIAHKGKKAQPHPKV